MTIPELYHVYLQHPVIVTDTRKIQTGAIFFALKGDTFNGNTFAAQAILEGCAYAVVDDPNYNTSPKTILVDNVLSVLQQLATYHRTQWGKTIVALTGSNGKTTTKELLTAVLRKKYNCAATIGNLNNHIGVPLTLLAIKPEHAMAVVEMGANHQKEIEFLCALAQPNVGLITNVGKAHLEGFGGEEGVLKGKSEMYTYLEQNKGVAFVNGDDEKLLERSKNLTKVLYGYRNTNEIHGEIVSDAVTISLNVFNPTQQVQVNTHLTGAYNGINVLCAFAVGHYFGVPMHDMAHAIAAYEPDNSRSQIHKTQKNTLILDAYNANPSSLSLALDNLCSIKADHKYFVIGEMREMGAYAEKEHLAILQKVQQLGLNGIFVGAEFCKYRHNFSYSFFETAPDAKVFLQEQNLHGFTILIKGSRGIKLEQVIDAL